MKESTITDKLGRSFKTLRVSLTSACNLACLYCVDEGASVKEPVKSDLLSTSEYLRIIRGIHESVGLETVRLTGGEPLLYKNITDLISGIKKMGVPEVKITTNGSLLSKLAPRLAAAGLDSANVSLDAADPAAFQNMTRRKNIGQVLEGIEGALESGISLKLNSVIMKHVNHGQILPLLKFAGERNLVIRFLELMQMGHLYDKHNSFLFSQDEILKEISTRHGIYALERKPGATARYWRTASGQLFGIIANESEPFCRDCTRLRLDSHGNIYGCLSNSNGIKISHVAGRKEDLDSSLRLALAQKQQQEFTGSKTSMKYIGG
ncbi:MAG: GTP 3',8-cyclase MoaA [Cytophagaceae bacterium]